MALIKIRLNLQKSQTSTKMTFAYLCSSSGSLLSFDELASTWVISWSSISCLAAIFSGLFESVITVLKRCTYLKLSSVLVQLTAGCLPELHVLRMFDKTHQLTSFFQCNSKMIIHKFHFLWMIHQLLSNVQKIIFYFSHFKIFIELIFFIVASQSS